MGWAGIVEGKRIGSACQTKGISRGGDTGKVIDPEWLVEKESCGAPLLLPNSGAITAAETSERGTRFRC